MTHHRLLRALAGCLVVTGALAVGASGARAEGILWADFANGTGNEIGIAGIDGSSPDPSYVTLPAGYGPCGVAADQEHLWWAGWTNNEIGRADIDGSNVDSALIDIFPGTHPCGVAVDDSHVYWAATGSGSSIQLGRADLDGSNVEPGFILVNTYRGPCGVAVDDQHIYWASNGNDSIGRADLDGGNVQEAFIPLDPGSYACGVAVDDSHIYWSYSYANSTIGRANLDGSNPDPSFVSGASGPCGVAVDDSHLYWANSSNDTLGRSDLGGGNVDNAFIDSGGSACGIAVVPKPPPTATITSGPSGAIRTDTATFEFTANEQQATFECSVDSGALAACSSPVTIGPLAEGDHEFSVRATDFLSQSGAAGSRQFTVDTKVMGAALTFERKQRQKGRAVSVSLKAAADEDVTVEGVGFVRFMRRGKRRTKDFEPVTRDVPAGQPVKLEMVLDRDQSKRVLNRIEHGRKPTALIKTTFSDTAGNKKRIEAKIRLRR